MRATDRDYSIDAGVDVTSIESVGAGEYLPIASNVIDEGRVQDHRAKVLVLGRLNEQPGG